MGRVTLKVVAAQAGVSVSTASRALAGNPAITKATTDKVRAAASHLNYRINAQARALRSARSYIIGLTVPSLENPYFATMAHVIQQAAAKTGLSTIISSTAEDPAQLATSLDTLASEQVDGILAVPYVDTEDAFTRLSMPVVLVDRTLPASGLPTVVSDPRHGIEDAVIHLLEQGHERIGYLSGPMTTSTGADRLTAFEQICDAKSVTPEIFQGGYDRSVGYEGTLELLDRKVDAIIAGDSMMSVGALEACHARQILIGQDLALIGYDDSPTMRLQAKPVTVIDQHVADLGTHALRLLLSWISDTSPPDSVITPTTLIIRPSSDFINRR